MPKALYLDVALASRLAKHLKLDVPTVRYAVVEADGIGGGEIFIRTSPVTPGVVDRMLTSAPADARVKFWDSIIPVRRTDSGLEFAPKIPGWLPEPIADRALERSLDIMFQRSLQLDRSTGSGLI